MEWLQSSLNKDLFQSTRSSPYKINEHTLKRQESSDLLISHLKQSYNERVQYLENQVKQIYQDIDNDALLETMGRSEASSLFKNQRIQEIVEDSLLTEKEVQIDALIHQNSILKADLISLKEDSHKLAQVSVSEITNLQATASELNGKINEQHMLTRHLEQENEALRETVAQLRSQYEGVLNQNEGQSSAMKKNYREAISDLEHEVEDMKRKRDRVEAECTERDRALADIKLDRDALRKELVLKEENLGIAKHEIYRLEGSVKELLHFREKCQVYAEEIQNLKEHLKATQKDLRDSHETLKTKNAEISALFLLENQQKAHEEKVGEMKKKYKTKSKKQKEDINELESINKSLSDKLSTVKQALEIEREQLAKAKSLKEDEIRVIKLKWEEKLSKQELDHQRVVAELKAKNQLQVSQLESEKSKLEAKNNEALNYASNSSSLKRSFEMESKAKFESSVTAQVERDYILKSKHENILAVQTLELQSKHVKEIQKLTEEFEREQKRKVKNVQESAENENSNSIKIIKESKRIVEQELEQKQKEITILEEKQDELKKNLRNVKEDLDDYMKKAHGLQTDLADTSRKWTELRGLYDTETKKTMKLEGETRDLVKEKNELSKKKLESDTLNHQLREQLQKLEEIKRNSEDTIRKLEEKNNNLKDENKDVLKNLENLVLEKQAFRKELDEAKKEFERNNQKLNQKVDDEKKEAHNRDMIIQNERFLKESLENTVQNLQYKEKELRTELASTQEYCKKLQTQLANQRADFKAKLTTVSKLVSAQIQAFKRQLDTLKSDVRVQSEKNQSAIKLDVQSLLLCLNSQFTVLKSQKEDQVRVMSDEHQKVVGEYEKNLQKYIEENSELYTDVDKLNKHVNSTLDTLEEAKAVIAEYTTQIEALKKKNSELVDSNLDLKKELRQSHGLISEAKKEREELEANLPEVVNRLKHQHHIEIAKLTNELDELKRREATKLRNLESSILELEKDFEGQLEDQKRSFTAKLAISEAKMADIKVQYEEKIKEVAQVNDDLERTKEKYQALDRENKRKLGDYEEKIENFKITIKKETLYNEREKDAAHQENSKLRRDLSDLKQKLQVCDFEISNLNQVRNEQQECIMKYKNILDKKRDSPDRRQKNSRPY